MLHFELESELTSLDRRHTIVDIRRLWGRMDGKEFNKVGISPSVGTALGVLLVWYTQLQFDALLGNKQESKSLLEELCHRDRWGLGHTCAMSSSRRHPEQGQEHTSLCTSLRRLQPFKVRSKFGYASSYHHKFGQPSAYRSQVFFTYIFDCWVYWGFSLCNHVSSSTSSSWWGLLGNCSWPWWWCCSSTTSLCKTVSGNGLCCQLDGYHQCRQC